MKLIESFNILSPREKRVHALVWVIGLIMINIPDWRITMGPFHSHDFSLIIPSIYGLVLNAALFYSSSSQFQQANLVGIWDIAKVTFILFFKLTLIEALIDCGYFALHYWTIDKSMIVEIIWGQILMNFIFFYLPSVMFGIIKAWQVSESKKEIKKIAVKDGTQVVHLSPDKITHIESAGNYVIYHAQQKHTIRQSLAQAEEALPDYFARSHKSFIVNTRLIERQTYNELIVGGFIVPIGRKYKNDLKAILDS